MEVIGSIYTDVSEKFQWGICPIARCIKANKPDLAVIYAVRREDMSENIIGNIYGFDGGNYAGNVYAVNQEAPTIRTYQGGNQQPMIIVKSGILQLPRGYNKGGCHEICPAVTSNSFQENNFAVQGFMIRKITPLECWRFMGFADEDFRKAEKVNSNTQLYKQAGNSIVKNVLTAIFGQMIRGKENVYKNVGEADQHYIQRGEIAAQS